MSPWYLLRPLQPKTILTFKTNKARIKIWARADANTRYVPALDIYTGKKGNTTEKGVGATVVKHLCERLYHYYYHIYYDNFFPMWTLVSIWPLCIAVEHYEQIVKVSQRIWNHWSKRTSDERWQQNLPARRSNRQCLAGQLTCCNNCNQLKSNHYNQCCKEEPRWYDQFLHLPTLYCSV